MANEIVLENEFVKLLPLTLNNFQNLYPVASQKKLVVFSPTDIETPEALKEFVMMALELKKKKQAIPFIIFDKTRQEYAGSTRFMNIQWANKVLEIGSTWIGREFQGSGLNAQMKRLMLDYAFENMDFEKVEFRIDERNIRSRKAVEKLGAQLEGILRKNVYLLDGYRRNTCCYGLLREEWQANKPAEKQN
jgi:RimJ/RimL family protein N-acetyltransferase